jgi:hypothetical protein
MNPSTTQIVDFIPHISPLSLIIGFAIVYLIINIFGVWTYNRLVAAIVCGILTVFALFVGFISFWEALLGLFIAFVEFGSYFVWGTPKEKPAEPQQKSEIDGAFDKSQFNKRS